MFFVFAGQDELGPPLGFNLTMFKTHGRQSASQYETYHVPVLSLNPRLD